MTDVADPDGSGASDRDGTTRTNRDASGRTEAEASGRTDDPLLAVEDLETHYPITKGLLRREVGRVRAVDGVSFELRRGEALGLVGESGSGKTTTGLSILGLEEPTGGEVRFDGDRISDLSGADRRSFRRRAQLVVQDPDEAFNPRLSIGEAVAEPLVLHGLDDEERRRAIVADLLERVGLSAADADRYPHEFSGGERQRIAIARALAPTPDLIVADEPTSGLDARVQADVLSLLAEIRREFDVAILLVSHDVDVVRRFCDRVAVMYLGELVEKGAVEAVFESPAHPYTRVLLGSVPELDPAAESVAKPLTDAIPDPADPPSGCRFHTRCPELIPPADLGLPRELWRDLAAFRISLATGELPEEIAGIGEEPRAVREETVRTAFGLPDRFPDDRVDAAVEASIDAIRRGDVDAAADRLAELLPTVCERETPTSIDVDGRPVHCHRYDPSIEASPRPWTRREK